MTKGCFLVLITVFLMLLGGLIFGITGAVLAGILGIILAICVK